VPRYGETDVQIFNKALHRLGEFLSDVVAVDGTDTSKYGLIAGSEYQATRNEVLKGHSWVFAMQRALLVPNTTATNLTGFWYMYNVPDDSLRVLYCYSVLPQWYTTYPFKHIHISKAPYVEEKGILYTDLDSANNNPYVAYIQEQPLGTVWYEPLFVDAFVLRLSAKIATAVTGEPLDQKARNQMLAEYAGTLKEAKGKNLLEIEDDLQESGYNFWTDRARWTS
jgi:hypothetical protein